MLTRTIFTIFILTLGFTRCAHAAVETVDGVKQGAIFKADGKVVSAVEAVALAPSKSIERCTPIKGAMNFDGSSMSAYKCKGVKLQYDRMSKTGLPKWVAL